MGHDDYRRESGDNISTRLTYLLIGGGIGAVIALLFAPKSGHELRGDIADATRKGIDRSRETAQQLGDRAGEYYQTGRDRAGQYYEATRDRAAELYTQAAEKAGDVVSTAREAASRKLILCRSNRRRKESLSGRKAKDRDVRSNRSVSELRRKGQLIHCQL
jgi:gas vesicle protein